MQLFLDGCRTISNFEKKLLINSKLGRRILIFDLLIQNYDRKNSNIILSNNSIMPIDFNIAFNFDNKKNNYAIFENIMMTWFGMNNIIKVRKNELALYLNEAHDVFKYITIDILKKIIESIDRRFCSLNEKYKILIGLLKNRNLVINFLYYYWYNTILPDEYFKEVNQYEQRRAQIENSNN